MSDVNMMGGSHPDDGDALECEEQRQRRASIKAIMADETLTPLERRRSIQGLMDGRRRSSVHSVASRSSQRGSGLTGMAAAAAAAALEYDSSDDEDGGGGGGMGGGGPGGDGPSGMGGPGGGGLPNSTTSAAAYRRRSWASVTSADSDNNSDRDNESNGSVSATSHNPDPDVIFAQHSIAMMAAVAFQENPGSQKVMELSRRMEQQRPECPHYERNCTIIAACCGMAFGCRICHDDMPVLPPPVYDIEREKKAKSVLDAGKKAVAEENGARRVARSSSMPDVYNGYDDNAPDHHNIDRFSTTEVICRICFYRQGAKTNNCRNCGVTFGAYHCNICNLWMSAEENPYHCAECGFCRVGGKENFKHCFDCGMCIDAFLFNDHNCKVGKYMSNCPVCQEDLFSSRSASHEMPCGHAIHWHCFRELTSFDSRCPVCKKTAESHERMAPTWSAMAMGIALQPVPPELARVVTVVCTDCEVREENRRWHFLGVQCRHCTSFNTVIEETTMTGPEAASFLGEHEGSEDARAVLSAAMEAAREVGELNIGMDDGDDEDGHHMQS